MAIWVTADLHLLHKKIISVCRKQFKSIEEHDEYIINRYNSVVGKDDLVYFLGDVCFKPADKAIKLLKRLNGRKVLITGNHDQLTDNEYRAAGFIEVIRHPVYYNNNIILSHIPVYECLYLRHVINVHGHLHGYVLDLPNFFNVNVELTGFLPVNIEVFEEQARKLCIPYRWEPFGSEWYAKYYKEAPLNG